MSYVGIMTSEPKSESQTASSGGKKRPAMLYAFAGYDADGKPINGDLVYTADNPKITRQKLIETLVSEGKSLAGLNLQGAALPGACLRGANLRGACLKNANLDGADLTDADLREADLRGARLHGAEAIRALFGGANLTGAKASGIQARYASFRAAIMDGVTITDAFLTSAVLTHVHAHNTNFKNTKLVNADFGSSDIVECDLSGCDLRAWDQEAGTKDRNPELARHLPLRTRNTIVVNCTYDKGTKFCPNAPAFKQDTRTNKLTHKGIYAITAGSFAGMVEYVPSTVTDTAMGLVSTVQTAVGSNTFGVVMVVAGAFLVKEAVGDAVKDKLKGFYEVTQSKVREVVQSMERRGVSRWHLVAAIGKNKSLEPLRWALSTQEASAAEKGYWSSYRAFDTEEGSVILCDRRHLAMALGALSSNRRRGHDLSRDIVLVRCDDAEVRDGKSPSAFRFHKDGKVTAVWSKGGQITRVASYGEDPGEQAEAIHGEPMDVALTRDALIADFEQSLLREHGLGDFDYPREDHYLQSGRDGTILVFRTKDRKLDNPLRTPSGARQPALIKRSNEQMYFRNGQPCEAMNTHSPSDSAPESDAPRGISPA